MEFLQTINTEAYFPQEKIESYPLVLFLILGVVISFILFLRYTNINTEKNRFALILSKSSTRLTRREKKRKITLFEQWTELRKELYVDGGNRVVKKINRSKYKPFAFSKNLPDLKKSDLFMENIFSQEYDSTVLDGQETALRDRFIEIALLKEISERDCKMLYVHHKGTYVHEGIKVGIVEFDIYRLK